MPDYRAIAAAKARKYGYDPGLFVQQIKMESGFNPNARSGAGAVGIAQIVPRYHPGVDPTNPVAALDYAAKYMAGLYHKYGNYKDALSVYNSGRPWSQGRGISETQNYVSKILGAPRDTVGGAGGVRAAGGGVPRANLPALPAVPMLKNPYRQDVALAGLANIVAGGKATEGLDALTASAWAMTNPRRPVAAPGVQPPGGLQNVPVGGNKRGKVSVAGGANRAGFGIKPIVTNFLSLIGGNIRIGTGTNHSKMTVNGNVSDHWDGHAADIPAGGQALTALGRRALMAAGMPRAEAMKQSGGLYNLNWRGHRIQVIFNTHEGGNHFNHLHVGVR